MRSPPTRLSRLWRLLSRYARTPALSIPLGPWTSDDSCSFLILPASRPWPEPVDDPRIVKGVQFSIASLIVVPPPEGQRLSNLAIPPVTPMLPDSMVTAHEMRQRTNRIPDE